MKKIYLVMLVVLVAAMVAACAPAAAPAPAAEAPAAEAAATEAPAAEAPAAEAAAPSDLTFTTVVKIAGINWFNRMEEGVKKFGADTGINASLVGPAEADAAQQIPIIEDLIARAWMHCA